MSAVQVWWGTEWVVPVRVVQIDKRSDKRKPVCHAEVIDRRGRKIVVAFTKFKEAK